MAEKRMLTKKVTDSDAFIALPSSTQALYMHLNQGADDDGFNNQVQMAMFKAHASIDDVKLLMTKRFILQFDSGVIVIKHWRMANALRKDRYTPTVFQDELSKLRLKENDSYTEKDEWLPNGCQVVAKRLPQDREVKFSLVECSGGKCSGEENTPSPARRGKFKNVELSDEDYNALKNDFPTQYEDYIEKLSCYMAGKKKSYDNHYATIVKWITEDNSKQSKRESGNNIFLQIANEEGIV